MKDHAELLLGAHMSIAGGIEQALYRGAEIGCTAIQIFTHSNRQWHVNPLDPEIGKLFKATQKETGIKVVVTHASYLINLGSTNSHTEKLSIDALIKELEHCDILGIPYLVLHPGSGSADQTKTMQQVCDNLNKILQKYTGKVTILLETMAGQGSSIGRTFEQLAFMRTNIERKSHIGVCIDTCHIWCAGYDFSTPESYHKLWHDFDQIIGISHLKAIHMNDSVKPRGSQVDRHADIGSGTLGLEPFRLLMNDEKLFNVAKILETPKSSPQEDLRNLKALKGLLSEKNKKLLNL